MTMSTFAKTLTSGMLLSVLFWGAGALTPSSQVYASGGASSGPPGRGFDLPQSSPQQRRVERLYNQGRKVFRRKVSCNDGCLVARGVINNDNAAGFLLAMHNEDRFKQALDDDELQAVSVYMLQRYNIRIE